jgi:hypothetical protein
MIQMRKQLLQVIKTHSSSKTYLCSIQGDACGTLGEIFPPGYRVSNCEGYKQGSSWLRMQKMLRQMIYNAKREPTKGSILQARA